MMADNLPFRSQAGTSGTGQPVGAIGPFAERGQTAPGGASPEAALGPSKALDNGSNTFPAKLKG